jgi:hypothetical protein
VATGPRVVMHSELLIEMRPSADATAVDAVVTTIVQTYRDGRPGVHHRVRSEPFIRT